MSLYLLFIKSYTKRGKNEQVDNRYPYLANISSPIRPPQITTNVNKEDWTRHGIGRSLTPRYHKKIIYKHKIIFTSSSETAVPWKTQKQPFRVRASLNLQLIDICVPNGDPIQTDID